jgi:hypothetical protein
MEQEVNHCIAIFRGQARKCPQRKMKMYDYWNWRTHSFQIISLRFQGVPHRLCCLLLVNTKLVARNWLRLSRPQILYELWTIETSLLLPGTEPRVPGHLTITLATILIEFPPFLLHRMFIWRRMFLLASKLFYIYTSFDIFSLNS